MKSGAARKESDNAWSRVERLLDGKTAVSVEPAVRDELLRIPGLIRRWEFEQVLEPGFLYLIESAGTAEGGTPLFSIYRCPATPPAAVAPGKGGRP